MTKKIRPNEPCPCGSGKKYKKCCNAPVGLEQGVRHGQADRLSALEKCHALLDARRDWSEEWDRALDEFWLGYAEWVEELEGDLEDVSWDVVQGWLMYDYPLVDRLRVAEAVLEQPGLSAGERAYLRAMAASTMGLWEVVDVEVGATLTLRNLLEDDVVTVNERTASRTLRRGMGLAARVIPRGVSGGPEMDAGVLVLPRRQREQLLADVRKRLDELLDENPDASIDRFYETLPPLAHGAWLRAIFEPELPELANTDDEDQVLTSTAFEVLDEAALRAALDGGEADGIEAWTKDGWTWSGPGKRMESVSLGRLELRAGRLLVDTNSVERGKRARALVERLAGTAVRHRVTTHEAPDHRLKEALAQRARGRGQAEGLFGAGSALDPKAAEAAVLQHLDGHYRRWVDEPVPMLEGRTPREAVGDPALRPRVEGFIRDLEIEHAQARAAGRPAYDPGWMWGELGLRKT